MVAIVRYARFTVSYWCIGHYVGIHDVGIHKSAIISPKKWITRNILHTLLCTYRLLLYQCKESPLLAREKKKRGGGEVVRLWITTWTFKICILGYHPFHTLGQYLYPKLTIIYQKIFFHFVKSVILDCRGKKTTMKCISMIPPFENANYLYCGGNSRSTILLDWRDTVHNERHICVLVIIKV